MQHRKAMIGVCLVCVAMFGDDAAASSSDRVAQDEFRTGSAASVPGSVLVRVRAQTTLWWSEESQAIHVDCGPTSDRYAAALEADFTSLGASGVRPLFPGSVEREAARWCRLDRYFVVEFAGVVTPERAAGLLARHVGPLEGSWPLAVGSAHGPEGNDQDGLPGFDLGVIPDDPLFGEQYSLRNTGQSVLGTDGLPGADIGTLQAWLFERGAPATSVAVLDTGVEVSHPDFAGAIAMGYSSVGDPDSWGAPTDRHGTHVAGIVGARSDDGIGIAGVAPQVSIVPVRVFQIAGFGFEQQFLDGVYWAANEGVDVMSMSLGFPFASPAMRDAMIYARNQGVVPIASTGNTPGGAVGFPAAYAEVLAVSATNHLDELWPTSTTGPETEISAPGFQVLSAWSPDTRAPDAYIRQSGTSMAVPHVSGVAGLVRSADPTLSVDDVTYALISTAVDLGPPGRDDQFGFGRVHAGRAVLSAVASADGACRADINGDGFVNNSDVQLFINAFLAGELDADLAIPFGVLNTSDIAAFTSLVLNGCGDPAMALHAGE